MGINMATPFDGPSPGKAPTMVPMTQPTTASMRLVGVMATAKPFASSENTSTDELPDQVLGERYKP